MPTDRDVLFDGLTGDQREAILRLGVAQRYAPQAEIMQEGAMGSGMLIVLDGLVSVWSHDVKVNEVEAGSVVGVSALIDPHPRTVTLIAETMTNVLQFSRARMLRHLEEAPPELLERFFANAFRVHVNLVRACEERIVRLTHQLWML